MKIAIYNEINSESDIKIIDGLCAHNSEFSEVEITPLRVLISDNSNEIVGGLIAQTWWKGLEIQYFFIKKEYRNKGLGKELIKKAEIESVNRGCKFSYVDTFDFQAVGFYEKLGYKIYGKVEGFADKFTRYYLSKNI